jgi:DNA repair protein RecN (Recombination protein N)
LLTDLRIVNFAIIDQVSLSFAPGLNVLTGETGAGKSIVIDAVEAILGGKTGAESVRSGTNQSHVEGVFFEEQAVRESIEPILAEYGLHSDDDALILSRDIHASGRTVSRVNGRAVPLSAMQRIGQALVDIHGQSEHLSLLRPAYQLDLLDAFAGTQPIRAQVAAAVADLRKVRREIERLTASERELARRSDLLQFQANEISSAKLVDGEDEELERERMMLANAEKLAASADLAYQALYNSSSEVPSATERLGEALAALQDLARVDEEQQAQLDAVSSALFQVEDVGRTLRSYRDSVEFNPDRLQAVEERLDLIFSLKRKYGNTIAEIIEYGRQVADDLDSLAHGEERRAELIAEEGELQRVVGGLASGLSAARHSAARDLAAAVVAELADLNMKHARFELSFELSPAPDGVPFSDTPNAPRFACDATGADRVAFLLSPNPGEPPKPLAKIASGGEMSRVLLALKTVLSRADRIGTLIFDEVDVGIGGRSGRVVGEKMAGIALQHQVICITHLPQIASFADEHFRVAKVVDGERTMTSVESLDQQQRIGELAAMLAGTDPSRSAQDSAAEMLKNARLYKEKMRADSKPASA